MKKIDTNQKYVVAYNLGGLCNRIKCLISAMRYSDEFSRKLCLYWPNTSSCTCNFSDLFENSIFELSKKEFDRFSKNPNKKYDSKIFTSCAFLTLPRDGLKKNFTRSKISGTGDEVDFEYNRVPNHIRTILFNYIKKLKLQKKLRNKIEEFSSNFDKNTVSFHIRTWQKDDKYAKRLIKLFDIKKVYKIIDKMPDKNFFIASDSSKVVEKLIKKYGKRIIFYPKSSKITRNTLQGIEDALVELYLLSKNKEMVLSWYSTFSDFAWWLGGCKAKVKIIPLCNPFLNKLYLKTKLDFMKRNIEYHIESRIPSYSSFKKLLKQRIL